MEKFGLLFVVNVVLLVEAFRNRRIYLVGFILASFNVHLEVISVELAAGDGPVLVMGLLDGEGLFAIRLIQNQHIHSHDFKRNNFMASSQKVKKSSRGHLSFGHYSGFKLG